MFTNKKRAGINTFVCAASLYVAETPKPSIKTMNPDSPYYLSALSRTVLLDKTFLETAVYQIYTIKQVQSLNLCISRYMRRDQEGETLGPHCKIRTYFLLVFLN